MPLVVGWNDLKPDQINRPNKPAPGSPGALNTTFFRASANTPNEPTASINRYPAGKVRYSTPHFNEVDQFLVLMDGKGKFGRHDVFPYSIHFSRAYTPYGPLQSDAEAGWAFMVPRTRFDPGAQRLPEAYEKLKRMPNRHPWHVTTSAAFPAPGNGVRFQDVPAIRDDQGLFTSTLTMAAESKITAPAPSGGAGQYVMVVAGSLLHDSREFQAPAVAFVRPDESPFHIEAGREGLQAIIMNFPKILPRTDFVHSPSSVAGFQKWKCGLCSFAYDEAFGMPDEGIPGGTAWSDVPESWSCPECAARKSDFGIIDVQTAT